MKLTYSKFKIQNKNGFSYILKSILPIVNLFTRKMNIFFIFIPQIFEDKINHLLSKIEINCRI